MEPSGNKRRRDDGPGSSETTSRSQIKRGEVQEHFFRPKENSDKWICNYCWKSFVCPAKSGTLILNKHFIRCKQNKTWIGDPDMQKRTTESDQFFKEASAELIALAGLPPSFIHSPAWRNFCHRFR